jgi:hypothetical protein
VGRCEANREELQNASENSKRLKSCKTNWDFDFSKFGALAFDDQGNPHLLANSHGIFNYQGNHLSFVVALPMPFKAIIVQSVYATVYPESLLVWDGFAVLGSYSNWVISIKLDTGKPRQIMLGGQVLGLGEDW